MLINVSRTYNSANLSLENIVTQTLLRAGYSTEQKGTR